LFGILTIGGAPEIHPGVQNTAPTFVTAPGGIVFKELYGLSALGAFDFKNGTGLPKTGVLTGTFHNDLLNANFKMQNANLKEP
jgi:hypothetical protein